MESGSGHPELRPLYFGIIKRDVLPAPCQDTLKRACLLTCPTSTHISYRQPFPLGIKVEEKIGQPTSNPQASSLGYCVSEGEITRCLTIIQWLKRHKCSFHYLVAILSGYSSSHELLLEGSSVITNPWSQGSLWPAERGKEIME